MTTMTNLDSLPTTVLLDNQAFQVAQQFATQEATPQKRERVFLNTLAVYAVHNYLKLIDTETNLEQSDSWHPVKRSLSNIADLVVPNLGKLECLPIKPQDTSVKLPQARFGDRIAYIAVQFNNEKPDKVNLLGYVVPEEVSENVEAISLAELKPFEDLFEYLYELEEAQIVSEAKVSQVVNRTEEDVVFQPTSNVLVNLSQCLQNNLSSALAAGFKVLETLSSPQLVLSYQSGYRSNEVNEYSRRRDALNTLQTNNPNKEATKAIATLIDLALKTQDDEIFWSCYEALARFSQESLGEIAKVTKFISEIRLDSIPFKLTLFFVNRKDQEISVFIKVYSTDGQANLPKGLKLTMLDEQGEVFDRVTLDDEYQLIQYKATCEAGERFDIQLTLGDNNIIKSFIA